MPTPAETILAKIPLPTHLDSAGLRERWAAEIRRRAFFSARMASMGYIRTLQRVCAAYAEGRINAADARMRLRGVLDALGLSDGSGGLTDHGSDRRLGLILDTQRQMAATVARLELQTPEVLAQWPAWRLTRFVGRRVPRDDWPRRWRAAGEAVGWQGASRTRMVALKASPIWKALGDGVGGFKDTLGNPYPPFAYGSGMDWEDVGAEEAQRLGLPTASAAPQKASLDPADREILEAMRKTGLRAEDFLPPETRTVRNAAPCHAKDPANCPYHRTGRYAAREPKAPSRRDAHGTHREETLLANPRIAHARVKSVVTRLMARRGGFEPKALYRPDTGWIGVDYGTPGNPRNDYKGGHGLAHILAKHPEAKESLLQTLLKGEAYKHDTMRSKLYLIHDNSVAVLTKFRTGRLLITDYGEVRPEKLGQIKSKGCYHAKGEN